MSFWDRFRRSSGIRKALLAGHEVGEKIDLSVGWDGLMITVKLNGNILTECTENEGMFLLMGLTKVYGKSTTKALMGLTPDGGWKHR